MKREGAVKMPEKDTLISRVLHEAYIMGKNGSCCPFISDITADMKQADVELLIYAFIRRNFPDMNPAALMPALRNLLSMMAERWQSGARSRV